MADKPTKQPVTPTKKEARKQISTLVANALPHLKAALGEKKFEHRLKKAVKILSEGFTATGSGQTAPAAAPAPAKKEAAAPVKKAAVKKSPAKKSPAKKKAAKK